MMMQTAIYPGTFDPITNGHLDLIFRATKLFSKVIVAVASNTAKKPLLSLDARIQCVQAATAELAQVEVHGFENLLIDFARQARAHVIIRGLRTASDFEHEFQLAGMNNALDENIETVFLTPKPSSMFISSSLVREIQALGGDVSPFVPQGVLKALHQQAFS